MLRHVQSVGMVKCAHGIGRFAHDGKPPMLKEVEDLRHVVREFAATVLLWLSGTGFPQVVKVARSKRLLRINGLYTTRGGDR